MKAQRIWNPFVVEQTSTQNHEKKNLDEQINEKRMNKSVTNSQGLEETLKFRDIRLYYE